MIDFKPIEDFTFDDCVRSLDRHRAEGTSPDEELLSRYNSLLEALKAEEKRDYPSIKTIDGLERYIKKYSNLPTATRYIPQYLSKAKQELQDITKRKRRNIRNILLLLPLGCIIIIIVAGFITYKPRYNVSIPAEIRVSQYGDTLDISEYVDINNRYVDVDFNGLNNPILDGYGDFIYRNDNHNYYILGGHSSSDYFSLNWPIDLPSDGIMIFPMNIDNQEHIGELNVVTWIEIFGLRFSSETTTMRIIQDKNSPSFLKIRNLESEWCFKVANEREVIDSNNDIYIQASNNGIRGNTCPLFIECDGTAIQVIEDADWIEIEKRSDVYDNYFNLHLRVKDNRTSSDRSHIVKVMSGDKYLKFHISQPKGYADYLSIEKNSLLLRPDEVWEDNDTMWGPHYSVKILTDGVWDFKFDGDYSWIKAEKDVYDEKIKIQVKENDGYERYAYIIISTPNRLEETITITQLER